MRTEVLTESVERILDLTADEAAALLAVGRKLASTKQWWGDDEPPQDRSPIRCLPTVDGRWRVTVLNAVGLVSIRDLQLAVQPKIPTPHLLYLFAASGEFPRLDDLPAAALSGAHLWELVARWYATAATRLLRGDLIRDYEPVVDSIRAIRGRTQPLAVANATYRGRLEFTCEYDEFSIDTPLNRLLRAAAALVSNRSTDPENRAGARVLLAHTVGVGPIRPFDEYAQTDRRTRHYAPAIALARHILRHSGRVTEHGETIAWTFLIPTPTMVEAGILQLLRDNLGPNVHVDKHAITLPGSTLTFNPDIVFNRGAAIADVKYKLSRGEWNRADLYQVIAFATAYRTPDAAIITFRQPPTQDLPSLTVGDTHITEITWPADGTLTANAAANQLIDASREWLGAFSRSRASDAA